MCRNRILAAITSISSIAAKVFIIVVWLTFAVAGCRKQPETEVIPAFYYWKSVFDLSEHDRTTLRTLNVRKLYVKFFDVDWQSSAVPVAVTQFATTIPPGIEIIPTVFITNRTLKNIPLSDIESLAEKMFKKIGSISKSLPNNPLREIQIDCDWTATTREQYFALLESLKQKAQAQSVVLSATIRLHQILYRQKTGIPPVDRGMLMYYNMGFPTKFETKNSILDVDIAEPYIQNLESYPLPLDVALPVFSWGVLFYQNRFVKLLNNVSERTVRDHPDLIREHDNIFRVVKDTYLDSHYLYKDSLIRVEEVSLSDCQRSAARLAAKLREKQMTISLFSYDPAVFERYTQDELHSIFTTFSTEVQQ